MSIEGKCINKLMDDARAEGYAAAIEDAAKVAMNQPISESRSESLEGLRLSILDGIKALLSRGSR